MIAVRKNLTEILLEVTNEEIALVAKETLAKTRRKGSHPLRLSVNPGFLLSFCSINNEIYGLDGIFSGFKIQLPLSQCVFLRPCEGFRVSIHLSPVFYFHKNKTPMHSKPNQNCSSLCIHFIVVRYPISQQT